MGFFIGQMKVLKKNSTKRIFRENKHLYSSARNEIMYPKTNAESQCEENQKTKEKPKNLKDE
jgi:hypothetical protein